MTARTFRDVGQELQRVIDAAIDDLTRMTDAQAAEPLAPGKWSRKQVVGHMIDSASNNHQRFVRGVQDRGGSYPGYDQEFCVTLHVRTRLRGACSWDCGPTTTGIWPT